MPGSEFFGFGKFALDVAERKLLHGAEAVRLAPKAYDVLVALVRQSGKLLTKEELLAGVWPEAYVEEGILTVHVSALRKALGSDSRVPEYSETVAPQDPVLLRPSPSIRRMTTEPFEVLYRGRSS